MQNETIWKRIFHFFDKLEDKVRARLSRTPLLYAFIGGVGVILFWRGVWHIADQFEFFNGFVSIIVGGIILLITGAFVSSLIGNRIILTGLRGEKKLTEKTASELRDEGNQLEDIKQTLIKVEHEISEIKGEMKK